MIVACMAVYIEARTLGMAVNSVLGFVDKIIIVDGAWGTDDEPKPSDDGTLDIIDNLRISNPNKVQLMEAKAWRSEAAKREEYVPKFTPDDFPICFILDGDEVLFCGAEWLRLIEQDYYPSMRAFNVVIWNKGGPNSFHPRIYRTPFSYYNIPVAEVDLPIVIEHLEYLRPVERDVWRRERYLGLGP